MSEFNEPKATEAMEVTGKTNENQEIVDPNTPLFTFSVLSDVHITNNSKHRFVTRFASALTQIKTIAPNCATIVLNGDFTDNGYANEYDMLNKILQDNSPLPPVTFVGGNHEFRRNYPEELTVFIQKTGMQGIYGDYWLNEHHFIYFGTESSGTDGADISDAQVDWFKKTIAEKYTKGRPIFVFLHQPLTNTVRSQTPEVVNDSKIRAIVDAYPEVIFFSGHTHYEMSVEGNAFTSGATYFNTASTALLWTSSGNKKEGSQGYFVDVYANKVVVKGRDFMNQAWLPYAQYEVKTPFE